MFSLDTLHYVTLSGGLTFNFVTTCFILSRKQMIDGIQAFLKVDNLN